MEGSKTPEVGNGRVLLQLLKKSLEFYGEDAKMQLTSSM